MKYRPALSVREVSTGNVSMDILNSILREAKAISKNDKLYDENVFYTFQDQWSNRLTQLSGLTTRGLRMGDKAMK